MTTPSVGSSLLDDLLDGMAGRASSEPEQTSSGAAGESPSTPSAPSPQPTDPASRLLASIVTHPEIRRLERAWRGLSLLVERCSAECGVVVDAVHAEPEDVEAVLEGLYRRSLERASSGAEPVDLVIIAHALGPAPRDLERLSAWAEFGERLGAPVVIEALPTALGFDDVASIGRTRRRLRSDSDPRAVALRAVAARDASRWSMLVMNGLVGRPRHTGDVPRQLPRPAPPVTLHENEQLLLSPVWAIAAIAARSVERTGWPCALTGTNHGLLRDLPVHTLEDGAAGVATPLEALVDADSATEAALAGVTLLASVKNADSIVLSSAPMLYRGAIGASGTSPSASLGLADQFFAGRVGRAVSELAAAIPATSAPEAVEQVAAIAFAQLFAGVEDVPEISASVVAGTPPTLEVTVHPRGFFGVRLDEVGFAAPLA